MELNFKFQSILLGALTAVYLVFRPTLAIANLAESVTLYNT